MLEPDRPLGASAARGRVAGALAAFAGLVCATGAWAQPGPPLTVPEEKLDAAFDCVSPPAAGDHAVLLVHGTSLTAEEHWGWNYKLALPGAGFTVCTVQFPGFAFLDIQESTEYLVHAVRRMHAATSRRIDVFGHSQGGLEPRWGIRWWPDLREAIDDLVMLATPNHGATFGNLSCVFPCLPSLWQQSEGSAFLAALNSPDETPGAIDYTSIYSHTDWVIQPSMPVATAALDGAMNIAVQDVCPGRPVDHIEAAFDAAVYALVLDALRHEGPADPARIDPLVCSKDAMPHVDRVTALQRTAELYALASFRQGTSEEKVDEEPPLKDYTREDAVAGRSATQGGGAGGLLLVAMAGAAAHRRRPHVGAYKRRRRVARWAPCSEPRSRNAAKRLMRSYTRAPLQ